MGLLTPLDDDPMYAASMGGSSGSLAAAIQGVDDKLTVLDDKVDAEDVATFLWMSAHRLEGRMHPRVAIGTERLSFAWDARKKQFHDTASAEMYLSDLKHSDPAMQTFSKIERSLSFGAPLPHSDHEVMETVAAGLVSGRVWLIEIPRSSPKSRFVSRTSPEAFAPINPRLGTKVDFAFIASLEGDQWLRGYVPMSKGMVIANSGMTVASGFDLGQWNVSDLQSFGFSKQLIDKLKPHVSKPLRGMTKAQVIAHIVKVGPVPELTKAEADLCDGAVFSRILEGARDQWNRSAHRGVVQFAVLPGGWQTVWLSRFYQEGPGPANLDAIAFRHLCNSGKWQDAVNQLRSYKTYTSRAVQEADLLAKELPPPIGILAGQR